MNLSESANEDSNQGLNTGWIHQFDLRPGPQFHWATGWLASVWSFFNLSACTQYRSLDIPDVNFCQLSLELQEATEIQGG